MKLGKCYATNFGSYSTIELDFSDLGLCLIQGATGSGKSTLLDLPAWCLFGITSKDGTVDEVRSWNCSEPTSVALNVATSSGEIVTVYRIRGTSKDNDLYVQTKNNTIRRGKDIKETQKLLNELLGVDAKLYQYASYYSEFSPSSMFFMTTAKNRKTLLESLTDLSFPSKMQEAVKEQQKEIKLKILAQQLVVRNNQASSRNISDNLAVMADESNKWKDRQTNFDKWKCSKLLELDVQKKEFELDRTKKITNCQKAIEDSKELLKSLNTLPCKECGRVSSETGTAKATVTTMDRNNEILTRLVCAINPYTTEMAIVEAKDAPGEYPFFKKMESYIAKIGELAKDFPKQMNTLKDLENELQDLGTMNDLANDMRVMLLQDSISSIQDLMNHYLQTYFEGEFTVSLSLEGAEDLNTGIIKNGSPCSYTQLSKGQRGLLKFAFAMSVMKVSANNVGIAFHNIFLDEALDGLDTELKVKAVGLLQELSSEHSSVMIIDHSTELKASIDNRITVKLVADRSILEF